MEHDYIIEPDKIFTIFFIMLGPLHFIDSYGAITASLMPSEKKKLALKTGLISMMSLLISGFIGAKLINSWNLMPAVLLLAIGLIFFFVAISPIIHGQSKLPEKQLETAKPDDIALQLVITPHGMAALIVLLSVAQDLQRKLVILICLLLVMILNVLFMAFNKPGKENEKSLFSKILSSVLGTMQFALAIQIILGSLNYLGIIELQK